MTTYYLQNKQKWKTKYNQTEYRKTISKRNRKYMIVIPIPNGNKLKFRSFKDVIKYCQKEKFNFDNDYKDLINV